MYCWWSNVFLSSIPCPWRKISIKYVFRPILVSTILFAIRNGLGNERRVFLIMKFSYDWRINDQILLFLNCCYFAYYCLQLTGNFFRNYCRETQNHFTSHKIVPQFMLLATTERAVGYHNILYRGNGRWWGESWTWSRGHRHKQY